MYYSSKHVSGPFRPRSSRAAASRSLFLEARLMVRFALSCLAREGSNARRGSLADGSSSPNPNPEILPQSSTPKSPDFRATACHGVPRRAKSASLNPEKTLQKSRRQHVIRRNLRPRTGKCHWHSCGTPVARACHGALNVSHLVPGIWCPASHLASVRNQYAPWHARAICPNSRTANGTSSVLILSF
jgi:hypothetical protein